MNLKTRLRKLEQAEAERAEAEDRDRPFKNTFDWLDLLRFFRDTLPKHYEPVEVAGVLAQIGECIALLEGAIAAGRFGCHTEYHCHIKIQSVYWWMRADEEPPERRHGFPVREDSAKDLRECLAIDETARKCAEANARPDGGPRWYGA
jgi:hypothetical protein